jgi:hypothetical protein
MLVLGAATFLSVIGFAAVTQSRITTRVVSGANNWSEAGVLALSTADSLSLVLNGMPNWRTQFASGATQNGVQLGSGRLSFVLVDEVDGDLADNGLDPVRAHALGRVGDTVRVRSVVLRPSGPPGLNCLDVAVHAGDLIYFQGVSLTADAPLCTNNGIYAANGSSVRADVQAQTWIYGGTYYGTNTTGGVVRELPNASELFEYYVTHGTRIPLSALLDRSSHRDIDNTVLTPTYNPLTGETNPLGIYVIDCENQPVYVSDSRIVGTLVLLNAPRGSYTNRCTIRRYLSWEPAVANFPAILVDGALGMEFYGGSNLEESAHNVNYNPSGAPYNGATDSVKDDVYPGRVKGMIYAATDIYLLDNTPRIEGLILAGSYIIRNASSGSCSVKVAYDATYRDHPPPGFSKGPLAPDPGTWRWDSVPE